MSARALVPALAGLLFLSGVSAIVYQVLWLRVLSLTFGVTVYAASTVLAAFMAGLALGSFAAGRVADRARHPLRVFGAVEILIGACALLTPWALAAVHAGYVALFSRVADSPIAAGAVQVTLPFLVLIVPTALMGATMPLVMKSSLTRSDALGSRAALLYACNTTGAIAGALAAGFYLIPHVGLRQSFLLAASVNALVGLCAIALSFKTVPSGTTHTPSEAPIGEEPSPAVRGLVLTTFALSGFASLGLEIVWFRVLAITLGPSSYAFTVMLATVLAGIALGSAIITPVMRRRADWLQVLVVLHAGAALVALRSLHGLRRMPRAPEWLESIWPSALAHLLPAAPVSAGAILPTAIFFGLAFPVGLRLFAGDGRDPRSAERVGLFYSVNVIGGILGSVAAGFLLLPLLTSRGSLIALAGLFLLSALALQAAIGRRRPLAAALAVIAAVVFVVRANEVPRPRQFTRFASGPVMWHEEGVQTTVTVSGGPGTGNRVMYIDSHHQANDSPGMVFIHARIGLLPAVLHPHPRRALVVGLGGGATAGALSQYPGLELDVVELSGGVVRGSDFFRHVNFDVLRRENVNARVDDARNYLMRARGQYDVITADAIIPTNAGANNLYSAEYFTLVRNALAPGGIALHWNGADSPAEHRLILRAFMSAFPETTLWGDGKLMVGWTDRPALSRTRIESMLTSAEMHPVLTLMHLERFDHLARMFRANPAQARALAGEGAPLTDDRPVIEYFVRLPAEPPLNLADVRGDIATILQP